MMIARSTLVLALLGLYMLSTAEVGAQTVDPRYILKDDMVYDTKTDLTWKRCNVGQRWSKVQGCIGIPKAFSFEDAQGQASGEWRLPNYRELSSLRIDYVEQCQQQSRDYSKPKVDLIAFPDSASAYWTSEAVDGKFHLVQSVNTHARSVSLGWLDVNCGYNYRTYEYRVRLVRSGR